MTMSKELEALKEIGKAYFIENDSEFLVKAQPLYIVVEKALIRNEPMEVKLECYEHHVGCHLECPSCGYNGIDTLYEISKGNYCPDCGQKLEWSDK
ncbi:MAG: hypothetical protein ACOCWM_05755 [Cyclobacteriaceae bacterium]